ncbi:MAG: hypothetical protein R3C14_13020 [Caldilineaceae bacterium]
MSSKVSSPLSGENAATAVASPWPPQWVGHWRANPERLAWVVILVSFVIFVALFITVPLTISYTIRYLPVSQSARFDPATNGVLLYANPKAAEAIAITGPRDKIVAGNVIVADREAAQGVLNLISDEEANEVLGSLQLYAGSQLQIIRLSRPFFKTWSAEPYQAHLQLDSGQARVFTNSGNARPLAVQLDTPHGSIRFAAGSYQISVENERTDVTVVAGQATLWHDNGQTINIYAGARAWMSAAEVAKETAPAQQNLIRNGNFTPPVSDVWQPYQNAEGSIVPSTVDFVQQEGRKVAYFIHQSDENRHNEVGITQVIDRKVDVYRNLFLQLDVNLLFQNLPGAGYVNTEFPLRFEIDYTDEYGKDLKWGYGFYYRDPEPPGPSEVVGGEKIRQAQWHTYRSPNLVDLLGREGTRPSRINSIRIYASGWNYQSMVSEVYLFAE